MFFWDTVYIILSRHQHYFYSACNFQYLLWSFTFVMITIKIPYDFPTVLRYNYTSIWHRLESDTCLKITLLYTISLYYIQRSSFLHNTGLWILW